MLGLRERGLHGVEFIVADDHAGLKAAICEVLPEAAYQRCMSLSQGCPGPRATQEPAHGLDPWVDDDCLQELRWSYDRRDLAQARADLAAWIGKWQAKYPQLVAWGMNREPSHCARSARRSPSWSEPAADRELHRPAIFARFASGRRSARFFLALFSKAMRCDRLPLN